MRAYVVENHDLIPQSSAFECTDDRCRQVRRAATHRRKPAVKPQRRKVREGAGLGPALSFPGELCGCECRAGRLL